MKPVAWRKPNREWNCWDFAEELDDELAAEGGWEPLYAAQPLLVGLQWLMENSEGVVGLRYDGKVLSWPKVVDLYLPSLAESSTCAVCSSSITKRPDGWHHDLGFKDTDGCLYPLPEDS